MDQVLENTPEQYISTKRSVFRCLKRYLQSDFSEKPCMLTIPGLLLPELSFQQNLSKLFGWIQFDLHTIVLAANNTHVLPKMANQGQTAAAANGANDPSAIAPSAVNLFN